MSAKHIRKHGHLSCKIWNCRVYLQHIYIYYSKLSCAVLYCMLLFYFLLFYFILFILYIYMYLYSICLNFICNMSPAIHVLILQFEIECDQHRVNIPIMLPVLAWICPGSRRASARAGGTLLEQRVTAVLVETCVSPILQLVATSLGRRGPELAWGVHSYCS